MIRDLDPNECRLLDALHDRTLPTSSLPGPVLAALTALGYVEVTWAGRARLTATGRELFEVVVSA